jgi:hypothetical protein
MAEAILELDEAQKIAMEYVCRKESVANTDVEIESVEPFSWCEIPVYVVKGKITRQTIDPINWQGLDKN